MAFPLPVFFSDFHAGASTRSSKIIAALLEQGPITPYIKFFLALPTRSSPSCASWSSWSTPRCWTLWACYMGSSFLGGGRRASVRKRGGVQKYMGHKVPWKIGMLICHPVTSRPLIFPQEEAVLSPCNFAITYLTACVVKFYLP